MTNKELSQIIRNELKSNGYNAKMVSVSVKNAGYSSAAHITIKSPKVNKKDIENIVNKYEEIDRDERTQEILQGCNVYMYVRYADGIFDEVRKPFEAKAKELFYRNNGECVKVADDIYLLKLDDKKEISQRKPNDHCRRIIDSAEQLAEILYRIDKFNTAAL